MNSMRTCAAPTKAASPRGRATAGPTSRRALPALVSQPARVDTIRKMGKSGVQLPSAGHSATPDPSAYAAPFSATTMPPPERAPRRRPIRASVDNRPLGAWAEELLSTPTPMFASRKTGHSCWAAHGDARATARTAQPATARRSVRLACRHLRGRLRCCASEFDRDTAEVGRTRLIRLVLARPRG